MASSSSSDEGEIQDGGVEKATTSLPQFDGTPVDRPDRTRNRYSHSTSMSPEHAYRSRDPRSRERSRSPYSDHQPRGSKRAREEEYPDRSRDPRRFKVHYEDIPPQDYYRRSRVPYDDLDRGSTATSTLRYDDGDRDRNNNRRPRTRSRSPYRSDRASSRYENDRQSRRDANRNGTYGRENRRSESYSNGVLNNRDSKDQSVSKRGPSPLPADNARHEAKITQGHSQQYSDNSTRSGQGR